MKIDTSLLVTVGRHEQEMGILECEIDPVVWGPVRDAIRA
jgi:hypothetical protein